MKRIGFITMAIVVTFISTLSQADACASALDNVERCIERIEKYTGEGAPLTSYQFEVKDWLDWAKYGGHTPSEELMDRYRKACVRAHLIDVEFRLEEIAKLRLGDRSSLICLIKSQMRKVNHLERNGGDPEKISILRGKMLDILEQSKGYTFHYHRVKENETFSGICKSLNRNWKEMAKVMDIRYPGYIYTGKVLAFPTN